MAKVTIERHRNKLRLRFRWKGKRHSVSTFKEANAIGYAFANQLKSQIELDIQAGYFDETLLKYQPRTHAPNATEISLPELFRRFVAHEAKVKALAQGTLRWYSNLERHLEKELNILAHTVGDRQACEFLTYLTKNLSSNTVKRHLYALSNCWSWSCGNYHVSDKNPWPELFQRVKPSPKQPIKPFSRKEFLKILEKFRVHPHYQHYYPFVHFLINTGVRFGEAAALQWKHVSKDYKTVWIGESVSRGTRKATKTNKARTLILNSATANMLRNRFEGLNPSPQDLVFPSPKGLAINDKLFRQRPWKSILRDCGIEYRKPYALRHSVASHAAASGLNPVAIAEQLGHDKRVFFATYAHDISSESVFQEFS